MLKESREDLPTQFKSHKPGVAQMICVPVRAQDSAMLNPVIVSAVRNCHHCGEPVIIDVLNATRVEAGEEEIEICCIYCALEATDVGKKARTAENKLMVEGNLWDVVIPNAALIGILRAIAEKHPRV